MKRTTDRVPVPHPLYRTVLSLAVAALVAAWLPFTVFYVKALSHTPAAQGASVTYRHGQRIITRTSGGQTIGTAAGSSGAHRTQIVSPVTTRVS